MQITELQQDIMGQYWQQQTEVLPGQVKQAALQISYGVLLILI